MLEFLSELCCMLIFRLFVCEKFAECGGDLEKGYLVIVDTATQLVECGQNREDVVLASFISASCWTTESSHWLTREDARMALLFS